MWKQVRKKPDSVYEEQQTKSHVASSFFWCEEVMQVRWNLACSVCTFYTLAKEPDQCKNEQLNGC